MEEEVIMAEISINFGHAFFGPQKERKITEEIDGYHEICIG